MKNKKSNKSRRKLLKSLAAGSSAIVVSKSLPGSWSKPVVDSVILPAHAQTTGCCDIAGTYCWSDQYSSLEITVNADGSIMAAYTRNQPDQDPVSNNTPSSVTCAGGSFNIPNQGDGNDPLSGTIVCGSDTIELNFDGDPISATKQACAQ